VKTPKLYFADLGTLCYLAGLKDPDHAMAGPMGGALFENAVLIEVLRTLTHRGQEPQVYFWRTSAGAEVDFVVDTGDRLIPVEAKLSTTPNPAMAKGINALKRDFGARVANGYVVHPGDTALPLGPNATALPFAAL
jgi:predicted AAA+ superfamily ATPase